MTPERVAKLKLEYPDITIWNREMEIDPNSRGGQKVFPEYSDEIHLIEPVLPLRPEEWTVYLACDPHPRRAHAFVWLAVNRFGEMVVVYSWWPEEENQEREANNEHRLFISEYVEEVNRIEAVGAFPPSYRQVMDSAGQNFDQDEEHNYFDAYETDGFPFQPAKKNRKYSGYDLIHEALSPQKYTMGNEEIVRPKLRIMRGLGDNHKVSQQFRDLRFKKLKGDPSEKDAPPDPMNKDRHLIDCVSYNLLAEPEFIPKGPVRGSWKPNPNTSSLGY